MKKHNRNKKMIFVYFIILSVLTVGSYIYGSANQRAEVTVLKCNGNRPVDILVNHEQFAAADPTKLDKQFTYLFLTGGSFQEKEAEYKKKHPEDLVIGGGLIFSNSLPDQEFFKP